MNKEELLYMIGEMEKELQKRMTPEEYSAFSVRIAREAFRQTIESMTDGPFKKFVQENFEQITGQNGGEE